MPALPPVITSRTNARVKALRAAFRGSTSEPGELVGVEGLNLLREVMSSRLEVDTLVLRQGAERVLEALRELQWSSIVVLSEDVFASVVDTASPQGVAAALATPAAPRDLPERLTGAVLLLENVQDPGNLGTLIRSAEAFGVEVLYLTPGCANPWSPKTIRASAGSVFRARLRRAPIAEALRELRARGVRSYGAVVRGEGAVGAPEAPLAAPIAVVIGNEGAGLSAEALHGVDGRVHIPCAIESLNAAIAGSVLLYEVQRQSAVRHSEGTA